MDPELIVRFKAETTDVEKALAKLKTNLNEFSNDAQKASNSSKGLQNSNDNLGGSLKSLATGYIGLAAAMQAGKMFFEATKEVQKYENQLKVASGTQQEYGKNTQFLEELASKYNKNVIDLGSNFAQLTIATRGTNLEGAKTERLFAAVTATSAALQMSVDDTNGTFRAFIQMVSKGNVQAEELRGQLGERLYGAFNLAAKSMGVTTSELNKMLERGDVLASDLLPKLTVQLEDTFGATAQENANNLASNIDYAAGQATLFIAELGKTSGVTESVNDLAGGLGEILSTLRKLNKEGGIVNGFFDRMFTLPGNKLSGGGGLMMDPVSVNDRRMAGVLQRMKNVGKTGGNSFSGAQSVVNSDEYGGQYGIRDVNVKLEDKFRKEAESAAKRADAEVNRWIAAEIQASNDRIAKGLADAKYAQQAHYASRPATGIGTRGNTGTVQKFGMDASQSHTEFANPVTGDGSATNFDHITAGMDQAIADIEDRYKRLKNVVEDNTEQLNESITSSLRGAVSSTLEGVGSLAGALATGTADMATVGNAFMNIMATLFENIGKALAAHAATLLIAKVAISTMNPVGAAAGAALAFAAAGIARASMQEAGQNAFWTGGIVPRKGGLDAVPIMATGGEMILNSGQQRNMFSMLDGANSGVAFSGANGSNSSRSEVVGELRGIRMSSGDIAFSAKVGEKKGNYFRSRK